jgi:hypothetical protein
VIAFDEERHFAMGSGPILTFDTSAINRLADDPDSDALIAGLRSGFHVRLPFTTISEVAASKDATRRRQLLRVCSLLLLSGDCIDPVYEVIKKLVARFESPGTFDWSDVPIEIAGAGAAIADSKIITEDLAKNEREEARAFEKGFVKMFNDMKPDIDRLLARGHEKTPGSISELVERFQKPGGVFWNLVRALYDRHAEQPADDATIRRFTEACDPFRAMIIAMVAAQYDRCVRPRSTLPSLRTGRIDTFMATYLPYCDEFVTSDRGQLECFKQVALIAGLGVTVRCFETFRSRLFVTGTLAN